MPAMGIDGNLLTASDEDIDAVLARPQRIERLLYGEPDAREEKPLYGVITGARAAELSV
jgi:hypothetical protein